MKVQLAAVWHFSFAVSDPEKSAHFWTENFDLQVMFRSDEVLRADKRRAHHWVLQRHATSGHDGSHVLRLDSMRALRGALQTLKNNGVILEDDPGNEIGPTGPDSPHMGLWFHDPGGYRWQLSVQNGARER